jgi:dipeptidase D
MTFVSTLTPEPLWRHFDDILAIPRASKDEGRMRGHVIAAAERRGLPHRTDRIGNVVVQVPASPGREGAPTVVLQSHLDMVNEKNSDVAHDFTRDPILPRQMGEYIQATGTTLGADNGIGVATMLALMEAEGLVHGPLELLFTIDEETGLTGALELDPGLLSGHLLLNLDSEEEGTVTVGCAGGVDTLLSLPLATEPCPANTAAVELRLGGLQGGHSGMQIHLQRGNAIKLLARALFAVSHGKEAVPFSLASFTGGNKRNALPREAAARVVVAPEWREALLQAVRSEITAIQAEYRPADPGLVLSEVAVDPPERVWTGATAHTVLALLEALPHGVLAMSYDIPGLVETSNNVAVVALGADRGDTLEIQNSSRSSVASALTATRLRLNALGELAGAAAFSSDGYPGWKPDLGSALLGIVKAVHRRVLGKDPVIQAIHAGLECGLIGEKVPGMEMVSIGPQIEGAHSPDERVKIPSVAEFWRFLTALLEELAPAQA